MYKRLIYFLENNKLLFHGQFGFRSNHSTNHALLLITDKIQRAIENKEYACGIFLDLKKAFDTVDHKILLKKMEYYGVRGIANQWFSSYLINRKQFVSVGNAIFEQNLLHVGFHKDLF
jgi:retron-type reverse transcriptase